MHSNKLNEEEVPRASASFETLTVNAICSFHWVKVHRGGLAGKSLVCHLPSAVEITLSKATVF